MTHTFDTFTHKFHTFDVVDEQQGYQLLRRDDGRWTVVSIDRARNQVYSAMPGDHPAGGGYWYARICDAGRDYVARGYIESYARRVYRGLVAERRRVNLLFTEPVPEEYEEDE